MFGAKSIKNGSVVSNIFGKCFTSVTERYRTNAPMRMLTRPSESKVPFTKRVSANDDSLILRRRLTENSCEGTTKFPGLKGTFKNDHIILRRRLKKMSVEPVATPVLTTKYNEE